MIDASDVRLQVALFRAPLVAQHVFHGEFSDVHLSNMLLQRVSSRARSRALLTLDEAFTSVLRKNVLIELAAQGVLGWA